MTIRNFVDSTVKLGPGAKVWHFARVMDHAELGIDVSVGSGAEIGRWSKIGDYTRISAGVFLPAYSTVGSGVFIGPNTTFTDDRYPKVSVRNYIAEPPTIGDHASIGAGCVILPGVVIGEYAEVGAGTVVVRSVPAHTRIFCPTVPHSSPIEPRI